MKNAFTWKCVREVYSSRRRHVTVPRDTSHSCAASVPITDQSRLTF